MKWHWCKSSRTVDKSGYPNAEKTIDEANCWSFNYLLSFRAFTQGDSEKRRAKWRKIEKQQHFTRSCLDVSLRPSHFFFSLTFCSFLQFGLQNIFSVEQAHDEIPSIIGLFLSVSCIVSVIVIVTVYYTCCVILVASFFSSRFLIPLRCTFRAPLVKNFQKLWSFCVFRWCTFVGWNTIEIVGIHSHIHWIRGQFKGSIRDNHSFSSTFSHTHTHTHIHMHTQTIQRINNTLAGTDKCVDFIRSSNPSIFHFLNLTLAVYVLVA